jgi:pimeloyl-ACP methyl ester carboxylesterase
MSMLPALLLLALTPSATQEAQPDRGPPEKRVERVTLSRGKDEVPLFMEWTDTRRSGTPTLVLLHSARSSKAEYRPIVPRLAALGYNCLAVDMRYGLACRGLKNSTAKAARDAGRNVNYLDALVDIIDALAWAREHTDGKVVLWGSSFSAGLALHLAGERSDLVDGVIAFSPGEYFASVGKGTNWIQECAPKVECPVFVTSARSQEADWKAIYAALAAKHKVSFLPSGPGANGSEALWEESEGHAEYWTALEAFLARAFPTAPPADK